ncbi:MAG: aminotransferase class I/II-fold pyridoxal phosphate-dependent enzyme [Chloroflexi bacterium]|nr:aminotransferase class I/II-fold pyridoxal phosphate-dependent enzyme [Chloroflexota bacterium]
MANDMLISKRVQAIPPSGIRRFFDIAATMTDVISLGIGEPDFITPPRLRQAGTNSIERGETKYTSNAGTIELRRALSDHLAKRYRVRYDPNEELVITVGVSEALTCAMLALIDPGDEVIIPEPCFVAYKPSVMLAGGVPVVVPTRVENDFKVTGLDIERAVTPRTKAILIGYPNNPTGAVMTRDRLLEVARVAEEHNLLVFSDEIYDRLVYGIEHVCFASLSDMRDRTILLGGFSKDYAMTGWRVGYAAASAEILAAINKVHQYVIMSAPTMGQAAALEGLRHAEEDVQAMVREYDQRRQTMVSGFNAIGLPTFEPRGAFYAFPDIRSTGLTSEEFVERLLVEEHVAVIPGNAFGACGEGFVRAVYAASMANIEEALTRIERFVKSCR